MLATSDIKVRVNVTSVINYVTSVYGLTVSRYFSPAEYKVNGNELKDP
jgi:hypothetical protein